jgi:hypothetical protein
LALSHGITWTDSGYFKRIRCKTTSKKKKKKIKKYDKKKATPYHPSTQRSDGGFASKLKFLQGKGQHEENPFSDSSELGQSSEVEQPPLDLKHSNGNLEPARNTQENTSQIFHCDLCPENFSSQEILMMVTKNLPVLFWLPLLSHSL